MRFSPTPWLIAGIAFVVLGFSRGMHSSFGVFNVALLDTFGWSRGATAGIFSVVLTMDALLSPAAGYLLDRYGTKKICVAGCARARVGTFPQQPGVRALAALHLFRRRRSPPDFTFTGMVPHIFLISEWFSSKRASAIGLVYAGSGVGIMLLGAAERMADFELRLVARLRDLFGDCFDRHVCRWFGLPTTWPHGHQPRQHARRTTTTINGPQSWRCKACSSGCSSSPVSPRRPARP